MVANRKIWSKPARISETNASSTSSSRSISDNLREVMITEASSSVCVLVRSLAPKRRRSSGGRPRKSVTSVVSM